MSIENKRSTIANPSPLGLLGLGMTTILLNLHNAGIIDCLTFNIPFQNGKGSFSSERALFYVPSLRISKYWVYEKVLDFVVLPALTGFSLMRRMPRSIILSTAFETVL